MTTIDEQNIPQADFAVIGGSGTLSSDFPSGAPADDVKIIADSLIFQTPYGKSPAFRLFTVADKTVICCKMHGWRTGVT